MGSSQSVIASPLVFLVAAVGAACVGSDPPPSPSVQEQGDGGVACSACIDAAAIDGATDGDGGADASDAVDAGLGTRACDYTTTAKSGVVCMGSTTCTPIGALEGTCCIVFTTTNVGCGPTSNFNCDPNSGFLECDDQVDCANKPGTVCTLRGELLDVACPTVLPGKLAQTRCEALDAGAAPGRKVCTRAQDCGTGEECVRVDVTVGSATFAGLLDFHREVGLCLPRPLP